MLAGVGSLLITFLPNSKEEREGETEQEVGQGYKFSMPIPTDVLPSVTPHLLMILYLPQPALPPGAKCPLT